MSVLCYAILVAAHHSCRLLRRRRCPRRSFAAVVALSVFVEQLVGDASPVILLGVLVFDAHFSLLLAYAEIFGDQLLILFEIFIIVFVIIVRGF